MKSEVVELYFQLVLFTPTKTTPKTQNLTNTNYPSIVTLTMSDPEAV